jgi:hypothetical protein
VRNAREDGQEIRRKLVEQFGNPFGSVSDYIDGTDFESQQMRRLAIEASRTAKAARLEFLAGV